MSQVGRQAVHLARKSLIAPCVAAVALAGLGTSAAGAPVLGKDSGKVKALVTSASANSRIASVLPARARNAVLGSRFTMTVYEPATGEYVFSKNAGARLKAASTTKIITSAAVLETYGAGHLMPTTALAAGAGVVVLRAGGDPLLTSANLRSLARDTAAALKGGADAGGAVTAPASASPTADIATASSSATAVSDAPTDTPSSPAAVSASGVPTDTAVSPSASATAPSPTPSASARLTLTPTPATGPATTAPAAQSAKQVTALTAVKVLADDSLFAGSGQSHGWPNSYLPSQVRPVNAFARDDNKARDAAADAGKYFTNALKSFGILATYAGEGAATAGSPTLATYPGHSVGAAVSRALLISDNDTAEMLFRQVAVGRGKTADWAGAREATADVLTGLAVPLSGVEIVDGSGLSLDGRLTAAALTKTLSAAISTEHPRLAGLRGWLPVAGKTGTLNRSAVRFYYSPSKCAAGRIQAKTGTVADSIALAGYANGADGGTKVFVAIVNGRPTAYSRLTTRKYLDRAVSGITGCW
ncbi:MAG: D-alanyl-D-alanine carboxypeptidase [Candidatus Nanopelagicales bacterium]